MEETADFMQRFKAYLDDQGLKFTSQRRVIAEAFFGNPDGHASLNELLATSQMTKKSIGYATVYRTMKLLTESGVALEHKFADTDQTVYEPNREGDHHDHIICLTCGHIVEFEDEAIEARQDVVAVSRGFAVRHHRHEIYADCITPDCEHRDG